MSIEFQWDKEKASLNFKKHGVTFEEATTAFYDALSITIADKEHSSEEARYLLLGISNQNRLLVVSHTDRGDTIRVISARPATNMERKYYEATE
jgi:uncharacterized DUF497 family protein